MLDFCIKRGTAKAQRTPRLLGYTLKCLNVTNGGANLYEVGKFSHSADEVMLSNSIWDPANLNRVSDTLVTA